MPGFRQLGPQGRIVAGYAVVKRNLGFYPHSGGIIEQFPSEYAAFKTSKGGILFTQTHPLPRSLIERLITARLQEIACKPR